MSENTKNLCLAIKIKPGIQKKLNLVLCVFFPGDIRYKKINWKRQCHSNFDVRAPYKKKKLGTKSRLNLGDLTTKRLLSNAEKTKHKG